MYQVINSIVPSQMTENELDIVVAMFNTHKDRDSQLQVMLSHGNPYELDLDNYKDYVEELLKRKEERKHQLYYTVDKHFVDVMGSEEVATGTTTITVYEVVNNVPKIFCEFDKFNTSNTEEEIQTYLDNNGHGDKEFKLNIL